MGHNGNPNSLKNLERGRWKPGQSGNPTGRATGVVYPSELLHGLLAMDDDGTPKYTRADLEKIFADENAAPALVIAARWILDGMRDGQRWIVGKDGKLQPAALDPTPSRVRESLADRLEGKPIQSVHVQRTEHRLPAEIGADIASTLAALLTAGPEVLTEALADMAPAARAKVVAMLPVDTDAKGVEPIDGEVSVLPAGDDESSAAPTQPAA